MDGNLTIGRFGGVEVRLHWSLLAVFALIDAVGTELRGLDSALDQLVAAHGDGARVGAKEVRRAFPRLADERTFEVLLSEFRRVGVDPDTFSAMLALRPEDALRALRALPDGAGPEFQDVLPAPKPRRRRVAAAV